MTLFSLLIVMAIERVVNKSKQLHIATLAQSYFGLLLKKEWIGKAPSFITVALLAFVPSIITFFILDYLPGFFAFLLNIFVLWVCLGCPVTRKTYKRYLEAAHRDDFQACALHSMSFGNKGGDLDNVGKQLVLVNYRQYASVLLFFIFTGAAGVIFYSLVKEWVEFVKREQAPLEPASCTEPERDLSSTNTSEQAEDLIDADAQVNAQSETASDIRVDQDTGELAQARSAETLLFILDWIPVRITAFGFLVVGHFSNALSAWLDIALSPSTDAYDALAKVSKAAEDVGDCDTYLNEPLQLVKLVKRNIMFFLVALSLATMVGFVP